MFKMTILWKTDVKKADRDIVNSAYYVAPKF